MDKNAIKKFAVWARRELISRVSQRAAYFEITEAGFGDPAADSVLGRVLSAEEKTQRQALIAQIRQKGYQQVMEEVAYTWFNRFIALRFMEVNGYLPSHVRVFTDEDNQFKPQILAEAIHMELDGLDMQKVYAFKNANNDDGLFKYMVIVQCNALSSILPGMFQQISDYTELLFPDNLLRAGSVLQQMIELIPEEDWKDAVQIIGWLYQYYNAEKKDEVFAALKKNVKITKENIPAATQLFTPDWIVRYMVENSLGRLWLEHLAAMQVSEKPAGTDIVYNGDWHKADGTTITMVDAPTRIKISKVDITTSDEVEGAEMQIVDSNGTVVESWTSGPEPHYIEATLIAGATYTLVEAKAPTQDGYVPAASIQFTVEDDGKVQHVFMQDDYTKVSISKTDIATGAEVPGAHLQIVDGEGNVLAEWVTDGQPHYIERLPVGNLVLIETMAPTENGYVRAENVSFTVQPTGEIQRVEMKDDFTKVEISKKDITNGDELRGAHLRITDEEGSVVAEWVSDGQPRRIDRLQPGIYTLTETAAPASYQLAESIRFQVEESGRIQKVTMYDAPVGTFTITKMDEATNTALPGARLSLRDSDGYVIDSWYTNTAPHALPVLTEDKAARDPRTHLLLFSTDSVEHVYTLVEEAVPTGYLTADSITFKLMQMDGKLTLFVKTDGAWQKADEAVLKMFDARNPDVPVPDLHKNFPQTGSSTQ